MSNLTLRVIVAIVAIPVILLACYFGGLYFFIFTTAIIVLSLNEFYGLAKSKSFEPASAVGIAIAALMNAEVYSTGLRNIPDLLVFSVGFVLLFELARKRDDKVRGAFENVGTTLSGVVYIGLFGCFLTALREGYGIRLVLPADRDAGMFIISILVTIWVCDSAAYFVGKSIGKHKMSKLVSPNKTWEGAIAGFMFAVAIAVASKYLVLPNLSIKMALGTGVIVGTIGQAGDFVESLFKRDAGVKDSSHLIPGHGGVFDRFDSLLFSAPFIYLMLKYL
ncbi:MAG: phosphatidate cytidylyltransferase [Bacteroidetes bacterium]|nr:phosphatidate cytidylyltransferase [Bacteroidota bacterium]